MKKRKYFINAKVDRSLKEMWKAFEKNSAPYTGMTTQQILDMVRKD